MPRTSRRGLGPASRGHGQDAEVGFPLERRPRVLGHLVGHDHLEERRRERDRGLGVEKAGVGHDPAEAGHGVRLPRALERHGHPLRVGDAGRDAVLDDRERRSGRRNAT